jgi:superfamily II DNA/RNA helicase
MLSRVDPSKPYPQVLCLSPTFELAIQIGEVASKMSQFDPDIKIRYAVRGEQVHGKKRSQRISSLVHRVKVWYQFATRTNAGCITTVCWRTDCI